MKERIYLEGILTAETKLASFTNKPIAAPEESQKLYHASEKTNRQSIIRDGLSPDYDQTGLGAIFLTNVKPEALENFDIWAFDNSGLELEEDFQCPIEKYEDNGERWFMVYDEIPPSMLSILEV